MRQHVQPANQAVYNKPLPRITPLNRPFWDYARQSIFALQVCSDCGDAHIPEAPVCPRCLTPTSPGNRQRAGERLSSWADFHRAYWPGFADELPYRTCLIRLDEGPLIISNLVGDNAKARIGARVHVIFESISNDIALPKFTLD